jgi:hypothetical protein
MMHVLFLLAITTIIGVIVWLEWPTLHHPATKTVYLTIVIAVFILSVAITLKPDIPGPLQGIRVLFKPFILPWMRQ